MSWRLVVHGDAGKGRKRREAEAKIAALLEAFVAEVEKVEGHGVTHALFDGHTKVIRLRGEDNTMVVIEPEDDDA